MTDVLHPVVAKARSYLRMSTAFLTAALAGCSGLALAVQHEAAIAEKNFVSNSNVHVVTITHRVVDDRIEPLRIADVRSITDAAGGLGSAGRRPAVSPKLTLGAGLTRPDGEPISVIGLEPAAADLIGVPEMADGEGYTVGGAPGAIRLDVPVVSQATGDGVVSDRLGRVTLELRPTADASRVRYLEGGRVSDLVYVTTSTFWRIASVMFDRDRAAVESAYDSGELPMIPLVGAVYVDVPRLDDVRPAAAALEGRGYGLNFALQAFDDVERSVRVQQVLGAGLGGVTLVGVGTWFVLSWRSYLRLSRRDIGILKHWGVAPDAVVRLYRWRLTRSLLLPVALALVVLWAGSAVLFGLAPGAVRAVWNSVALLVAAGALHTLVSRLVIVRAVAPDVLTLFRADREFQ